MKTNAYDVAIAPGQTDGYRFSMDPAKVIASLEEIIEGIKSNRLLPQRATFETCAQQDEYPMTYVHLSFYERDAQ
jgi:hypothetical protein